jgi:hypothetical protein
VVRCCLVRLHHLAGPDTNYDLALYRWGLQLVLELDELLDMNDVNVALWRDTLERCVGFSLPSD